MYADLNLWEILFVAHKNYSNCYNIWMTSSILFISDVNQMYADLNLWEILFVAHKNNARIRDSLHQSKVCVQMI